MTTLKFHPTADLADVIGPDILSSDVQFRSFGKRKHLVGRARTVKVFQDNKLVKSTLQTPGDGQILIVDGGASIHTALIGDVIATFAVEHKWEGAIVLGAIRDSHEIDGLDVGIKALGTNPRKSTQVGHGDVDVPVSLGNIIIHPGDIIFSDEDGVVAVPPSQQHKLAELEK